MFLILIPLRGHSLFKIIIATIYSIMYAYVCAHVPAHTLCVSEMKAVMQIMEQEN